MVIAILFMFEFLYWFTNLLNFFQILSQRQFSKKFCKFLEKSFASSKNFSTFAVPFERTGFFNEFFDNTERLKVQASTEKV